jgi:beta-galactosidase/beta-glucuronidase
MSNQLRNVTAQIRKLSPVEAEIWLTIEAEAMTPSTEVRGRVLGPHCPGISTVEVSYPLKPLPNDPSLTRRVAIPDPNLWSAEKPFVYTAIIELWQDGQACDRRELEIGLRMSKP